MVCINLDAFTLFDEAQDYTSDQDHRKLKRVRETTFDFFKAISTKPVAVAPAPAS